jgi:3-deoxy-D-manno-octulosonate 8-phosphate phosphatase (KDO 8-P phosphatase)
VIELLVFDVDGCLTDGNITCSNSGDEFKNFNVKDGFGILCWQALGKKCAIITGKSSKIVEDRAKLLKIEYVFQGVSDKDKVLEKLLKELNLDYRNVAAIGDDLNDLKQLKKVGWSFAPSDALSYVKENVDTTLSLGGGKGCVREMIEKIIEKENLKEEYLKPWL